MKISRVNATVSEILQIFIRDSSSTTGAGLTGLTNASSGLTAYYCRNDQTGSTVISVVTMTLGTFTSGGFKEIDATNMPGWYQFCPPNAVFSGGRSVAIHLKGVTNMAPLPIEIEITASNNQSATVFLSSGTGAGQLDITAGVVKANAVQLLGTAWLTPGVAGTPDVNVKTWNALTAVALPLIPTTAGRTLDVSATGEAGVDWANVGSPTTALALTGTTISSAQVVASVIGAVGSVTGAVGSVTADVGITQAGADKVWASAARSLTTFGTLVADVATAVWGATTRLLSAGTNIVLAKGTGVTGFTDLDAAGVRTAVGLASANLDTQLAALPTAANVAAIKAKTDNLPPDPADASDIAGAFSVVNSNVGLIPGLVWDVTLSSHLTSGTTGAALNAAGAAGDPWSTALPGAYGSGTAGKIVGDNINATISSRATASALATAQADLDDIQTRLPAALVSGRMDASVGAYPGNTAQTGDAFARLGAPAGASVSADIAAVKVDTAAVKVITDHLGTALEIDGIVYRFTTNALEQAPTGGSAPTVGQIADAVWDEAISGHLGAGSTGLALNDATAAGNPWNAVIEGTLTAEDLLRLLAAVAAGKTTITALGGGAATVKFRTVTDSADMVIANMAGSERTGVSVTP